ncbi:MAG: RNA methyltransferase [Thermoplasmata archaeon]|nr:RNA methyltransferase [Thermoplasmata archaeon]
MADFVIIFVSPKYSGNIGSLARIMKNFDLNDLVIVSPQTKIDDDAYRYAMHGEDIIKNAKVVDSLDDAIKGLNLVIATSAISTKSEKHFLRISKTPEEIASLAKDFNGKIGLLFGREDIGLLNEELEKSDMLLTIPASADYPVMNITHAAAIIFYEIFKIKPLGKNINIAKKSDLDRIFDTIVEIINLTRYPEHKKKNTFRMIRRILGRSAITAWEYHVLIGVLKDIKEKLNQDQKMTPP